MKKLFLIGNGFDLAHHGLETRYSDFILWYLNQVRQKANESQYRVYEDDLMKIQLASNSENKFNSIEDYKIREKNNNFSCSKKYDFFLNLINSFQDANWVDIEREFFCSILNLYKPLERHENNVNSTFLNGIKKLNKCMDLICAKLIEYLETIDTTSVYNEKISQRLKDELIVGAKDDAMFLVFNYTDTLNCYLNKIGINDNQVIYIHGKLRDKNNPIIFGYGDEMDEYYQRLEYLQVDDIFNHFKSFSYCKTFNLMNLSQFLERDPYYVIIMGHSCGLSDRVLLNEIFCHRNCMNIKIYFHDKGNGENDYLEKYKKISRHFPPDQKTRMRKIILPYPGTCSLS